MLRGAPCSTLQLSDSRSEAISCFVWPSGLGVSARNVLYRTWMYSVFTSACIFGERFATGRPPRAVSKSGSSTCLGYLSKQPELFFEKMSSVQLVMQHAGALCSRFHVFSLTSCLDAFLIFNVEILQKSGMDMAR